MKKLLSLLFICFLTILTSCEFTYNADCVHEAGSEVFTTDTTHYKKCTICGSKIDEVEHEFNGYIAKEEGHYQVCSCGYKTQISEHTFDEGKIISAELKEFTCTICNYHYTETIEIEATELSITDAIAYGKTLEYKQGTSTELYQITGTVVEYSNKLYTITDGTASIGCYSKDEVLNMYPGYEVTIIGNIQNYYGTIEITNFVVVNYIPSTYSITLNEVENGEYNVEKLSEINYGEKILLTATPNEGYVLKKIIINGIQVLVKENTYLLEIKCDTNISVVFDILSTDSKEKTTKYTISDYPVGKQYEANEVHILDDNTTVTTTKCHFTSEIRIYSSSTNNGNAVIYSKGLIKEVTFGLGNAIDNLNVYVSTDGETYELYTTISVDNALEKDYTVTFDSAIYSYIKLDVEGTNQIRVYNFTLTYAYESKDFTITSIEMVGTYGDSSLVQYDGYDLLIDGGTSVDSTKIKETLSSKVTDGIIDLLVISHPDTDHYKGLEGSNVFKDITEIKTMLVNPNEDNKEIVDYIKSLYSSVNVLTVTDLVNTTNKTYTIDVDNEFKIDVMYNSLYNGTSKNNSSIPLLINYKNTKAFLAGDMENQACSAFMTMYPNLFDADDFVIFKALHHGSNGSNSQEFLNYLMPDLCYVSSGMKVDSNNGPSYNTHPYLEAMVRIGAVTPYCYWNGINGTITITCDGTKALVEGTGRTKDYSYNDGTSYIMADRIIEINLTYFESKYYLSAILDLNKPDYAGILK